MKPSAVPDPPCPPPSAGVASPRARHAAVLTRRDGGEASISHLATVLLVTAVAVALVASGLPAQIAGATRAAVCEVAGTSGGGRHCDPGDPGDPAGGGTQAPGAAGTGADGGRAASRPTADGGGGDRNCSDAFDWFCGTVDGLRIGTWNAATDIWEGAVMAVCLVPWCDSTGDNWRGIGNLFRHPRSSAVAIWDESTKAIRDDWNGGHRWRAGAMTIPTVLGKVFGRKGLILPKITPRKLHHPDITDRDSFIAFTEKTDAEVRLGDAATLRGDIAAAEKHLAEAQKRVDEVFEISRQDEFEADSARVDNAQYWLDALKGDILLRKALLELPRGQETTDLLVKHRIKLNPIHITGRGVVFHRHGDGTNRPTIDIGNNHGRSGPLSPERAERLAPAIVREIDRLREEDLLPDPGGGYG